MDAVKSELDAGSPVDGRNRLGLTALHAAKLNGYVQLVDLLVSRGADPELPMPPPEQLADALLTQATEGEPPGIAVLVSRNGEVLFKKGYGFADLEKRVPITETTRFRVGSITKQFTAGAILKLEEEGKLSVGDPLSRFFPEFPRGREVTLRHLLTHTSGIHSYTDSPGFLNRVSDPVNPEDLIAQIAKEPYDFDPGAGWHYSNSGYFLLGNIVEKVSGETLDAYLRKSFFEPLGMKATGIHRRDLDIEEEALGYSFEEGEVKPALDWDMSWAGGAGALYSTVGDLFRWNEGIFNATVLRRESLEVAWTPVQVEDSAKPRSALLAFLGDGYGCGWVISRMRGLRMLSHGGGLNGFVSFLGRFPDQELTIAVLSNAFPPRPQADAVSLAQSIAQFYLWEIMEPQETFERAASLDPLPVSDYVGRYDMGLSMVMMVTSEGDKLFGEVAGQPRTELVPKSADVFFPKGVEASITFLRSDDGEVTRAVLKQGGREIEMARLEEIPTAEVDKAALEACTGEYEFSPEMVLTISNEEGRLFAQATGQPRFEIFPKSETEFFWKVMVAEIEFVKDEEGKVVKAIHRQAGRTFELKKVD